MRCANCGHELIESRKPITEKYRGEEITVAGIRHFNCDVCGSYELMADDADKLSYEIASIYAVRHGLLAPREIRTIRKSLGMTQRDFERVLGVSSPTCSRWENGAVQQSNTADKLMRIIARFPEALAYLMNDGQKSTASYRGTLFSVVPDTKRETTPSIIDMAKEG